MRYVFLFLFVAFTCNLQAQQTGIQQDTTKKTTTPLRDSLKADSLKTDSLNKNSATKSGLTTDIDYHAEDSIHFSVDRNIVYLYGKARVSYEGMELSADYIRLDQKNKTLFASGLNDKWNRYRGRPIFKQGEESPISTDSLVFNMESKKGKTYGSFTEVEGGYISAAQSKKNPYNEISFRNGIYSTCNLPHPHFGIHISKGLVTEKQVISGPAYLEIEDIPIPVILPFGFFPKTNKRSSGFRFPTFGEDATLGFFIRNAGWYFGINDYWDADVLGTVYSKGSYEGSLLTRYRKNYKYNGQLNFAYAAIRNGIEGTPEYKPRQNFNLQWSHTQDQAANPGTNFGANVNISTSSYFQDTRAGATYDINRLTQTSLSSSVNYSRTFFDNLFNFNTSLSHRQDLATQVVSLQLPVFSLAMTTINPFENKERTGAPKWYEKIAVGYTMNGSNTIEEKEYNLLDSGLLNARNGISHAVPISMNFNVLKYLQFSTNFNYNERWSLQTYRQRYDRFNRVVTREVVRGFARNYDYSFGGGLSTKLYGMAEFKKGKINAIRHVMTPSANFTYTPDFSSDNFGFYDSYTNNAGVVTEYSIFEGTVYGGPGRGRSAVVSFGLDNTIEAKVKSKSDTASAFEKIPIIQGLNFSGSYNFLAENYKLSNIGFSGRTAFFKQKLAISFNGTFDPYQVDSIGNRIDRYTFREGRLPRLVNFGFSTGYNFNSEALQKRQENLQNMQDNPNTTPQQQQDISSILRNPNEFVDFTIPWSLNASYSFGYTKVGLRGQVTNTLNFNGDFSVTPKWKVSYTSGWDFKQNTFSPTSFSINRDLHCWDMAFTWMPFGLYKSYSFDLRVRASILQDLKLSRRSSYNPF